MNWSAKDESKGFEKTFWKFLHKFDGTFLARPPDVMGGLCHLTLDCLAALPLEDAALQADAVALAQDIRRWIEQFSTVTHPRFGKIYAYEVDGLGHVNLMDDANVPSLLAMPFIGYCPADDPIYLATRAFVPGHENPCFFAGTAAAGVGSPHPPPNCILPISLCIQRITSDIYSEKFDLLETLMRVDAGTGLMHEGFHKDDCTQFTRPWFAWANSMFAEFVIDLAGKAPKAQTLLTTPKNCSAASRSDLPLP